MKSGAAGLVRLVVTLGLVAILLMLVDLQDVVRLLTSAHPGFLLAAFGVAVADRAMMIGKWYPLLHIQMPSASVGMAARVYLASGLANFLLPASVGADLARATALGRRDRQVVEVGASIVAERVLGMIALGIMSIVALTVALNISLPLGVILPWSLAAAGGGVALLLVPMNRRFGPWIAALVGRVSSARPARLFNRFGDAYSVYLRRPRILVGVAGLSFLEQGLPIVIMWLVARSIDVTVDLPILIVAVPLASFAARLPISIGGLGVGDGAFVYLLTAYGVSVSDALAVALAGRIVEITVMVAPAVVLWRDLVEVRRAGSRLPVAIGTATDVVS